MKYLNLVALVLAMFSFKNAYSAEDCSLGGFLKVYVQQATGEFKESKVTCAKLVTNALSLEETLFSDLTYTSPFYFEVRANASAYSAIEVFRCGSPTQAQTLKDLAAKVLSKIKDKKPEFEIEPESDFGVIQKISKGENVDMYTPNNYPARIMSAYALGPLYPFETIELGSDCTKIQ